MSPRAPSDEVRSGLVDAAVRLVVEEGPAGLKLRRVADDAGVSTMAVYTYFGGMDELRRGVRQEAYARLAVRLDAASGSGPLQRLVGLCVAYTDHGVANPELYRVMFMEQPLDEEDAESCAATFAPLVEAVADCVAAGELSKREPLELATELWVAGHGVVTLRIAELLSGDQAATMVASTLTDLLVANGADARKVSRALRRATAP